MMKFKFLLVLIFGAIILLAESKEQSIEQPHENQQSINKNLSAIENVTHVNSKNLSGNLKITTLEILSNEQTNAERQTTLVTNILTSPEEVNEYEGNKNGESVGVTEIPQMTVTDVYEMENKDQNKELLLNSNNANEENVLLHEELLEVNGNTKELQETNADDFTESELKLAIGEEESVTDDIGAILADINKESAEANETLRIFNENTKPILDLEEVFNEDAELETSEFLVVPKNKNKETKKQLFSTSTTEHIPTNIITTESTVIVDDTTTTTDTNMMNMIKENTPGSVQLINLKENAIEEILHNKRLEVADEAQITTTESFFASTNIININNDNYELDKVNKGDNPRTEMFEEIETTSKKDINFDLNNLEVSLAPEDFNSMVNGNFQIVNEIEEIGSGEEIIPITTEKATEKISIVTAHSVYFTTVASTERVEVVTGQMLSSEVSGEEFKPEFVSVEAVSTTTLNPTTEEEVDNKTKTTNIDWSQYSTEISVVELVDGEKIIHSLENYKQGRANRKLLESDPTSMLPSMDLMLDDESMTTLETMEATENLSDVLGVDDSMMEEIERSFSESDERDVQDMQSITEVFDNADNNTQTIEPTSTIIFEDDDDLQNVTAKLEIFTTNSDLNIFNAQEEKIMDEDINDTGNKKESDDFMTTESDISDKVVEQDQTPTTIENRIEFSEVYVETTTESIQIHPEETLTNLIPNQSEYEFSTTTQQTTTLHEETEIPELEYGSQEDSNYAEDNSREYEDIKEYNTPVVKKLFIKNETVLEVTTKETVEYLEGSNRSDISQDDIIKNIMKDTTNQKTPEEIVTPEKEIPILNGIVYNKVANFSIKITEDDTEYFAPEQSEIKLVNAILNITWTSSTKGLNNSLAFHISQKENIVSLYQLEAVFIRDDGKIKVETIPINITSYDKAQSDVHIKLPSSRIIEISNVDFLEDLKMAEFKDLYNPLRNIMIISKMVMDIIGDVLATTSEAKMIQLELVVICIALLFILGGTLYLVVKKTRSKSANDSIKEEALTA